MTSSIASVGIATAIELIGLFTEPLPMRPRSTASFAGVAHPATSRVRSHRGYPPSTARAVIDAAAPERAVPSTRPQT